MGEFVRLEVADGVGTIRLDRPKMNALDAQMQEEIRSAAEEATERDDVKAVVIYGGERVFAAGADVKEMAAMSHTDMVKRSHRLTSAFTAVARSPSQSSLRSPDTPSAAAASWPCAPTSGSPPTTRRSVSRRSCSASSPAPVAPSGSAGWSARAGRRTSSSPAGS